MKNVRLAFSLATTKDFPTYLEIAPNFFFIRKRILYLNKHFPKNKLACKALFFLCVHSVVLDTQKWVFFVSFSKTIKLLFLYDMLIVP